jgi:hypothetical protein
VDGVLQKLYLTLVDQVKHLRINNGKAYMAWKGSGDNHIWYSYYTDQTSWVPQEPAINGMTYFDTIPSGSL